mmetsp:Transcript_71429/g.225590  ORF Transcript_71429/g.225590 Transcript_71429/m.225590 type:complete len:286 (-) Transcript_71429:1183-2040(-)
MPSTFLLVAAALAPFALRRRNIHARVPREEPVRLEHEPRALAGHHREVLRAWHVANSEGVPHHHVLVVDAAVRGGPRRQPLAVLELLNRIISGGEFLVVPVWCHPEALGGEEPLLRHGALRAGHQRRHGSPYRVWHELVRHGAGGDGVDGALVLDAPAPGRGGVDVPLSLGLAGEGGLDSHETVVEGIAGALGEGLDVHFLDGVLVAIHGHVEARAEHVLVDLRVDPGSDDGTVGGRGLAGREQVGGELPSKLDLEVDGAVLAEGPVEEVLVVDHGGDGGEDQLS